MKMVASHYFGMLCESQTSDVLASASLEKCSILFNTVYTMRISGRGDNRATCPRQKDAGWVDEEGCQCLVCLASEQPGRN
jgi:hypothetical protein